MRAVDSVGSESGLIGGPTKDCFFSLKMTLLVKGLLLFAKNDTFSSSKSESMTETEAARVLDEVAKESPRLYERLYFALVLAFRNVRKAHPARSSYSVQVKTVVSEMVT